MRGRYRVNSEIGTGGLGKVWKGTTQDGSPVAIKEPLDQGTRDQVRMNFDKLRVEAEVLERLTATLPMLLTVNQTNRGYALDKGIREHIVRFLDVDRIDAPSVLVLEFVNGRSFDDKFRSVTPKLNEADQYSKKILGIVRGLHQNNILHRDISPHNLIASPQSDKDPVLIDFGTVKEGWNQISAPQWSHIMKAGYSAPELGLGVANPSSDLYSTAATILFMYTGVNPQYLRTSTGELDDQKPQLQKIPRERIQVLKKAMSYHPSDRYQTADDLLNALAGQFIEVTVPHIVASGQRVLLQRSIVIGRQHGQCEAECRRRGFSTQPDLALYDPERYIGRHHAIIRVGPNGECVIEDLHTVSGTAIKHAAGQSFERLQPGREYRLQDGDVIALAYNPTKGAYMTVSYHA